MTPDTLLRHLDGTLSDAESRALAERLAVDEDLRRELERLAATRDALREARAGSFGLGFAERVMRRIDPAAAGDDALYRAMRWLFRRAAVVSLVILLLFGALNFSNYRAAEVSASVIESIFGLPTVTLDDALAYEPIS